MIMLNFLLLKGETECNEGPSVNEAKHHKQAEPAALVHKDFFNFGMITIHLIYTEATVCKLNYSAKMR